MNYEEAREYIEETARFNIKLGLSRTEKILELLGNPHKKLKFIHIAGTNGKGSTTAMISTILKEAGYKVGMYTSPYIEEFEERIQIDGNNISKEDLAELITKVSKAVEKTIELGYDNPTQFEIITCAGFLYFYEKNVDFAVIEVGLGGRLDATNVITPILSIITSISYDHMDILGNTLYEIAYEKAGIIKEGIPVILYPQEKEAGDVIKKVAKERKAPIIEVKRESAKLISSKEIEIEGKVSYIQNIKVNTSNNEYNIDLALLGKHQLLNCATAVFAVEELENFGIVITKDNVLNALKKVKWMGRFEILKREPLVVIDGAHNIDGIRKLKESVECYLKYDKLILIVGILGDKQVESMIQVIAPMADKIICVTPHNERAKSASQLMDIVKKYNGSSQAVEDYEKAYKLGLSYCNKEDLLLICGSLYMIGDMRKAIRKCGIL